MGTCMVRRAPILHTNWDTEEMVLTRDTPLVKAGFLEKKSKLHSEREDGWTPKHDQGGNEH